MFSEPMPWVTVEVVGIGSCGGVGVAGVLDELALGTGFRAIGLGTTGGVTGESRGADVEVDEGGCGCEKAVL